MRKWSTYPFFHLNQFSTIYFRLSLFSAAICCVGSFLCLLLLRSRWLVDLRNGITSSKEKQMSISELREVITWYCGWVDDLNFSWLIIFWEAATRVTWTCGYLLLPWRQDWRSWKNIWRWALNYALQIFRDEKLKSGRNYLFQTQISMQYHRQILKTPFIIIDYWSKHHPNHLYLIYSNCVTVAEKNNINE